MSSDIDRLRARNEELEEENRQLRAMLIPPTEVPTDYRLTPTQARMYRALVAHKVVTKTALFFAISEGRIIEDGNLNVQVYKLRKKLEPFGIAILSVWGVGFQMRTDEAVEPCADAMPMHE